MFLAVSQIHAHQHRCPVLTLGATGAGVDLEHHAEFVLLAAEHIAQFEFFNLIQRVGIHRIQFGLLHGTFFHKVKGHFEIVHCVFHLLIPFNPGLEVLDFFHLDLRFLRVLPKVGHMGAQLLFFYFYFLAVDVKDTSSAPACAQKSLLIVPELSYVELYIVMN